MQRNLVESNQVTWEVILFDDAIQQCDLQFFDKEADVFQVLHIETTKDIQTHYHNDVGKYTKWLEIPDPNMKFVT